MPAGFVPNILENSHEVMLGNIFNYFAARNLANKLKVNRSGQICFCEKFSKFLE